MIVLEMAHKPGQNPDMNRDKNRDTNLKLRNGWYSFRTWIDGKEIQIALGTQDPVLAKETADTLRRNIEAERIRARLQGGNFASSIGADPDVRDRFKDLFERLGLLKIHSDLATIDEIDTAFREDAAGRAIGDKSVNAYLSYLRRIVRVVHQVDDAGAGQLRASVLTWQLLHDYQAKMIAEAKPLGALAIEKATTSSYSAINQAQAVFSEAALKGAKMRELRLPDLKEFKEFTPDGSTRKVRVAIDDDTLARLRQASDDLWFTAQARWLAFALCGGIGLRRGEAVRARWDWAKVIGGKVILYLVTTADGSPKGNEHKKEIELSLWQDMQAVRQGGDFIIPGEDAAARERALDENVQWLRALGFDMDKPNHELRAIYLQALDRQHGREAAQLGAGHSSARTTEIYTGRGTAPAVRSV